MECRTRWHGQNGLEYPLKPTGALIVIMGATHGGACARYRYAPIVGPSWAPWALYIYVSTLHILIGGRSYIGVFLSLVVSCGVFSVGVVYELCRFRLNPCSKALKPRPTSASCCQASNMTRSETSGLRLLRPPGHVTWALKRRSHRDLVAGRGGFPTHDLMQVRTEAAMPGNHLSQSKWQHLVPLFDPATKMKGTYGVQRHWARRSCINVISWSVIKVRFM